MTVNVLIKDGNRVCNWDFPVQTSVGRVLEWFCFTPVPGSVRAGSMDCGKDLEKIRLRDCPQELSPDGISMRVNITLRSKKPAVKSAGKENKDKDVC